MPINELEIHPFLDSINDSAFGPDYFEAMIIGSFPVYSVTNSIQPNGHIEERFIAGQANMKYFYGSKKNSFWRLLSDVCGLPNPAVHVPENQRVQQAMGLLIRNKLLISDSLFKTNRRGLDAQDSALWVMSAVDFIVDNKSLNHEMDALLQRNPSVKYLYFTSTVLAGKSPFGWFKKIFGNRLVIGNISQVGGRAISAELSVDGREYRVFFLPSPAGNGTRGLQFTDDNRTLIFVNYIQTVDLPFYQEIDIIPMNERTPCQIARLTKLRQNFLLESWRQTFVEKNMGFDGRVLRPLLEWI
jgi:hypothetical protein